MNVIWGLCFHREMGYVFWSELIDSSVSFSFDEGRLDTPFLPGWFFVEMVFVGDEACYERAWECLSRWPRRNLRGIGVG